MRLAARMCCGVDAQVQAEVVPARLHGHHDLFERAIAGALAQAVDGALDLAGAADLHAGQRIGHRHAQVVVAMHRPDRLVAVGHALAQRLDEVAVELGNGIAHGVGHVDGGRAFGDHGLEHAAQEIHVAAVAVFGAELDVAAPGCAQSAPTAWPARTPASGVMRSFFSMCSARGGDEGVDARAAGALERFGRARDVAVVGARQRADGRVLDGVARSPAPPRSRRWSWPRKPASITSTFRRSSWRAMRSFSSLASWMRRATARRRARWCRK